MQYFPTTFIYKEQKSKPFSIFECSSTAKSPNPPIFKEAWIFQIKGQGSIMSCLKPSSSQGYSAVSTPTSSSQSLLSSTINLSQQYALVVQSNSYIEIRRTLDQVQTVDIEHINVFQEPRILEQVLRPSRVCVQEAPIRSNSLTHLVSTFFQHTERVSRFCLVIYQQIRFAHILYAPIHNLLDEFPIDYNCRRYFLSESQCESAYNAFVQFDTFENPFIFPELNNFDTIRQSFSHLRQQQIDPLLRKSKSTRSHSRRITALVGPVCCGILTSNVTEKEEEEEEESARFAQIDAAKVGAYVLEKELDTIGSLVARVHASVESDKLFIRPGLERGVDRYMIQEILKQMKIHRTGFDQQLGVLEEHLVVYFGAINDARSFLHEQILLHQNPV